MDESLLEKKIGPESIDRICRLLGETRGNRVLVALKGHLAAEELLYEIISSRARNPEFLDRARLSFSQAYWLARAINPCPVFQQIGPAIERLNSLRNSLAHKLETSDSNKRISEFVEEVGIPETLRAELKASGYDVSNEDLGFLIAVGTLLGALTFLAKQSYEAKQQANDRA